MVGASASGGNSGDVGADGDGVARACARGATSIVYSADGAFRLRGRRATSSTIFRWPDVLYETRIWSSAALTRVSSSHYTHKQFSQNRTDPLTEYQSLGIFCHSRLSAFLCFRLHHVNIINVHSSLSMRILIHKFQCMLCVKDVVIINETSSKSSISCSFVFEFEDVFVNFFFIQCLDILSWIFHEGFKNSFVRNLKIFYVIVKSTPWKIRHGRAATNIDHIFR